MTSQWQEYYILVIEWALEWRWDEAGILEAAYASADGGKRSRMLVPLPGVLSIFTEPPWRSMIDLTMERPRPDPSG
jgi:hypothetical protein